MSEDQQYGFQDRVINTYVTFAGALGEAFCAGFKPHRLAPHVQPKTTKRNRAGAVASGVKEISKPKGPQTYRGYPCKRGHIGIRLVSNNDCIECRTLRRADMIPQSELTGNPKGHSRGLTRW